MKKLRENIFKVSDNGIETDLDVEQVQELIDERNKLKRIVEISHSKIRNLQSEIDILEKETEELSHMINIQEL